MSSRLYISGCRNHADCEKNDMRQSRLHSIRILVAILGVTFTLITRVVVDAQLPPFRPIATTVLTVYVQRNFNTTAVTSSTPSGNNNVIEFGTLRVNDDPITEAADPKSRLIGSNRGIAAFTKIGPAGQELLLTSEVYLNISAMMAGTMEYQGLAIENDSQTSGRRLSVVGGSGSFVFATGFLDFSVVYQSNEVPVTSTYNLTFSFSTTPT